MNPESDLSRRALLASAGAALLSGCAASNDAKNSSAESTLPPSTTSTAAPMSPAAYVAHGPRTAKSVALTFHGSGDLSLTRELLAAAKELNAPITVFAVGTWLQADPRIGKEIIDGGHSLGNHTYTHPALGSLSADGVAQEVDKCAAVLKGVEGNNGRWFRPSGITVPTAVILEQAGLAGYPFSVGYDVDPLDYEDPGAETIVNRIAASLRPGSIISLHTGHQGTVQAFASIVSTIRARSLNPVTIGALLGA